MPDPAPQPQEQLPQVPRPPQDAVLQNIVAPETPAQDTPNQLEVLVTLVFPLYFLLSCLYICGFISRLSPSWSFIQFVVPSISFGIIRFMHSVLYA